MSSNSEINMVPHPIPYQGSKRLQASTIAGLMRRTDSISTLYEPFAGSAACTLYAASHEVAKHFVIGDSCAPIVGIWFEIINHPERIIESYNRLWHGQLEAGHDYYTIVRQRYNETRDDPHILLYLIVRCVKNAVRFGSGGRFTQSQDKRRLGMQPAKMAIAIRRASHLLKGRCSLFAGDFVDCVASASSQDFVYMDPPYHGTSVGRDRRYYEQLPTYRLVVLLEHLNGSEVPWVLSYDGMTGDKTYGERLPESLAAARLLVHIGRSSQSTLNGKQEETIESLYLAPCLSRSGETDAYLSLKYQYQSELFATG